MPAKKKKKQHLLDDNFWFKFLLAILVICLISYLSVLTTNAYKKTKYIGIKPKSETGAEATITVQGIGDVYAKPDLAVVTLSVKNEAKTANEAMQDNVQRTNSIIKVLKGEGVDSKDIKTTSFEVYPYYEEKEDGQGILVSYQVEQTLELKIREINKAGALIEEATRAGANQVGDLTLTIEDDEAYQQEARAIAIAKAKNKAELLSQQLGVKLAGLQSFHENVVFPDEFRPYYSALDKSTAPNIEIGENKIEVTVSITYKIN